MSAASEARDRLAALLAAHAAMCQSLRFVDVVTNRPVPCDCGIPDRLAEGDAAVTERDRLRERIEALLSSMERARDNPNAGGTHDDWYAACELAVDLIRRALAPAADHESGAT